MQRLLIGVILAAMRSLLCLAPALVLVAYAAPAWADTQSLAASKDTTLYADNPDRSNGAGSYFFAGINNLDSTRRALIAFDVAAAIPAGSVINQVELTLYLSRGNGEDQAVELYRVLAPWGEGASDAPLEEGGGIAAELGDATWSHRLWDTVMWTTAGGDFVATASASQTAGPVGSYVVWSGAGLVADVQGWLDDPASNEGWILIPTATGAAMSRRFDSRTNPDAAVRPELFIDFTPTVVVGACCAADGSCTAVEAPGAACTGTYQGDDTDCGTASCPQPDGACCAPNAQGTCSSLTEEECDDAGGSFVGDFTTCAADLCPIVPTPFVDELPIPPVAVPVERRAGEPDRYEMTFREVEQQLHSELPPTRIWGIGDGTSGAQTPGPTFDVQRGEAIEVVWRNQLRDENDALRTEHLLPVDTCLMGAEEPTARTVIHFHGGHVAADSDGHPEATFLPGEEDVYQYPNDQRAATLWYHDHSLGITRLNVYLGMAGAYLIHDAEEAAAGLPTGANDVPLVLQDKTFAADGSLVYPEMWMEHHFGNVALVNGRVWPRLEVPRGKMRFRIVAGSGSRTWRLGLSNGASFQQVGSDGGLLAAPVTTTSVLVQPGERVDVVIDFQPYAAGTQIVLRNDAPAPYPGGGREPLADVMRFDVVDDAGDTDDLPATLSTLPPIDEAAAEVTRDLVLRKELDDCSGEAWRINGLSLMDITEMPMLGTSEIWRFFNDSGFSHPIHMHLVMFRILDRQPYQLIDGEHVPTGPIVPPPPEEAGWKDTVRVDPFTRVRVIARFENYTGMFTYHCHMLEHEDHDMMRQFETMTDCGDGARGMPDEECDDGNLVDGDGCSADCAVEPSGASGTGGGEPGTGGAGGQSTGASGPGGGDPAGTGGAGAAGPGSGAGGPSGNGGGSPSSGNGNGSTASTTGGAEGGGGGSGEDAAAGDTCYCSAVGGKAGSGTPALVTVAIGLIASAARRRRGRGDTLRA